MLPIAATRLPLASAWLAPRYRRGALSPVGHAFVSGGGGIAKELKLLQLFHAHAGEVLSRDRLLNEVWGYNYYGTTRTLDQVIVQLRKKLDDSGSEPRHLVTVHGVGYKLVI